MLKRRQVSQEGQPRQNQQQQYQCIERIAYTIYLNRLRCNKAGSAEGDWAIAAKVASNPLKRLLFGANQPLIQLKRFTTRSLKFVGWDVPRWFLFKVPQLEWTKLIAVPLLLAVAGSIISSKLQRESNQIAALNRYIDQIETLTFEQKLLTDTPAPGAIVIARGRTVAALRELDIERRRQLLAFLQTSGLLKFDDSNNPEASDKEPVISFRLANLSEMDLSGAFFYGASLIGADLSETNLRGAFLTNADLRNAGFSEADLRRAFLMGADLRRAFLVGADLRGAFLPGSKLRGANLRGADLRGADLMGADLSEADLRGATLHGVDLTYAVLTGAQFGKGDGLSNEQKQDLANRGAIFDPPISPNP